MKCEITEHEWKIRHAIALLEETDGDIQQASKRADQCGIAIDSVQWRLAWWQWHKMQNQKDENDED